MSATPSNIVLIGMPGCGKSTVGVILAKLLGRSFVDTDILIQTATGRSLQDIVDRDGYMALREIEEDVILNLVPDNHVIATGGSAVYGHRAMDHLRRHGIVVFLRVDIAVLATRTRDFEKRGVAKRPDQTLTDLFAERLPLYRQWTDVIVECRGLSQEEICAVITDEVDNRKR
jgi:shikimate kinase